MENFPSQPLEGNRLLDLDFQPVEQQDNLFLMFSPPALWELIITAPEN
jgi:hypothetical protein